MRLPQWDSETLFKASASAWTSSGRLSWVLLWARLAKASAILDEKVGPALGEAGKALNEFSKTKLGPAMGEVGKAFDEFGRERLGPALKNFGQQDLGSSLVGTAGVLGDFGKDSLGPALGEVVKAFDEFGKETLGPALGEAGKVFDEFGREKVAPTVQNTGKWIETHPAETAMIAGGVFTFLFPAVIYSPILAIFGFGSGGPMAGMSPSREQIPFFCLFKNLLTRLSTGSTAAGIQAASGPVAAGSAFATAQSAAMGGYGSMIFGTVVQAGSAILAAAGLISGCAHECPEDAKSCEK